MALDPTTLLASLAAIIGLGYLGNFLFEKTRIPDVLLLVALGVFLGPVTHLLDPEVFRALAPTVGIFTLLIILFDGGLSLKFKDLFSGLARAGLLAVVGWIATVSAIGLFLAYVLQWDLKTGLLLGAILGGSSSIVIIPLVAKTSAAKGTKVTLSVESALTDVLCVVGALTIVDIIASGSIDAQQTASSIAAQFSIAIVAGGMAGLLWTNIWQVLEKGSFAYMITLAAVLLVHLAVEAVGGSGPIAVLTFGILLGNRVRLLKGTGSRSWEAGGNMRRFQEEITFFIRAFFFTFLGIILDLSAISEPRFIGIAFVLLALMLVARYGVVWLATLGSKKLAADRDLLFIMLPRGLAAAALAGVPIEAGIAGTEDFVGYAFALIVLTNLFVTFGMRVVDKPPGAEESAATPAP